MLKSLDSTQYQQLLEACPIGLLLLDKDGKTQWINSALRAWLGTRVDKIIEQQVDAVPRELQKLWTENATVLRGSLPKSDSHERPWICPLFAR